ncbi:hypothetical protein Tco_1133746 [Tanacetum coccineum]
MLSPNSSYPGPSARPNPIRGGRLTSGLSDGSNNGGNEVGADVGMGGGASGLVGESMKGGVVMVVMEVAASLSSHPKWNMWWVMKTMGDSGDAGSGEDIASNLGNSESDHANWYRGVMALELVS